MRIEPASASNGWRSMAGNATREGATRFENKHTSRRGPVHSNAWLCGAGWPAPEGSTQNLADMVNADLIRFMPLPSTATPPS